MSDPVFTQEDAGLVCELLRLSGTDPDAWSRETRTAVTRLHGYRDGRVLPATEQAQQPAEAAGEPLEGPEPSPDTPETAEGRSGGRRPHWLPEEVWLGVKVGEWPLTAFTSQESAERWAANAKWEPERQAHEQRRIWRVEIPVDTQTFKVETVPASTKLVEAPW